MCPNRNSLFAKLQLFSFLNVVCHESTINIAVHVLSQKLKKLLTILERHGKLLHNLIDTVEKLNKDWGFLIRVVLSGVILPCPFSKLVPEVPPIFFYQNSKSLNSSVVRIDNQLA
jgi:hypothetical protein